MKLQLVRNGGVLWEEILEVQRLPGESWRSYAIARESAVRFLLMQKRRDFAAFLAANPNAFFQLAIPSKLNTLPIEAPQKTNV